MVRKNQRLVLGLLFVFLLTGWAVTGFSSTKLLHEKESGRGYSKVLLVASNTDHDSVLATAVRKDTLYIGFNENSICLLTFWESIRSLLGGQKVSSLGLVAHGTEKGSIAIGENQMISADSILHNEDHERFFKGLGKILTPEGSVDIFSCGLAGSPEGLNLIQALEKLTDKIICASTNRTGNLQRNADWFLERGQVNIARKYFSENLIEYDQVLSYASLVRDILPDGDGYAWNIYDLNGTVYFVAQQKYSDNYGNYPYVFRSDGTESGTKMVNNTMHIGAFLPVNNAIYLSASPVSEIHNYELWKCNSSWTEMSLVKEFHPSKWNGPIRNFFRINDTFILEAFDGQPGYNKIWRSDGTEEGTELLIPNEPDLGIDFGQIKEINGRLWFPAGNSTHGIEPWVSDGTPSGTFMLKDINTKSTSYPNSLTSNVNFTSFNGFVFFAADDGDHGCELWKSDGTGQGTVMVKDILPVVYHGMGDGFLPLGNKLLFGAVCDEQSGCLQSSMELWASDGTEAGTVLFKEINPVGSSNPRNFALFGSQGVFLADDGTHGLEVWITDGTEAGTRLIKDIHPGPEPGFDSYNGTWFQVMGDTIYFVADDGAHGPELWESDGTEKGTRMVEDIFPGASGSGPSYPTVSNGILFFQADDGVHGKELWKCEPNTPPVISTIDDQAAVGNTELSITFSVNDAHTESSDLTVSVTSAHQELIPDTNIVVHGNGTERTITIKPATGVFGTAKLTITLDDGEMSASETFEVVVLPYTVKVTIDPPEAVAEGAQWRVPGGEWRDSGDESLRLEPGWHQIEFKTLAGWRTPESVSIRAVNDHMEDLSVTYEAVPAYDISSVPPQTIRHGETLAFYVGPGTLTGDVNFSIVLEGTPVGSVDIDPVTGLLTYIPAPEDATEFQVILTAESGGESVSQVVDILPMPVLEDEQQVLGLVPDQPLPDPEDKAYISINTVNAEEEEDFNTAMRFTREISITGKTLVFQEGHPNGLFDSYHDSADIKRMNLYAETVVVKNHFKLPQTDITIYAKNIRFEDQPGKEPACIDTTPRSISTRPELGNPPVYGQDGKHGLKAGDVILNIESFYSDPNHSTRFILKGSNGQSAGLGRDGRNGESMASCPTPDWQPDYTSVCNYYFDIGTTTCGNCSKWPENGESGLSGGMPGNGGAGGNFKTNMYTLASVEQNGGNAGSDAGWYSGGKAGTPVKACQFRKSFDGVFFHTEMVATNISQNGVGVQSPTADILIGEKGNYTITDNTLSWLHPYALQNILAHTKDAYLLGHRDYVENVLKEYLHLIGLYSESEYWLDLPEENRFHFEQQQMEMQAILYKIERHLDYFGNPEGWVPMLSFEANKTAFENEIDHAVRMMYLAYWLNHSSASIEQKVAALASAREELKSSVQDFSAQYTAAMEKVPGLDVACTNLAQDVDLRLQELEILEQVLLDRAEHNVEERHKVPFWKKIARVAGTICKVVPVPAVQAVGFGLDFTAGFDADEPWESIKQIPDTIKTYKEFKKQAGAWQTTWDKYGTEEQLDAYWDCGAQWDPELCRTDRKAFFKEIGSSAKPLGKEVKKTADVFKTTEAPKSEIDAELAKLKAESPEFQDLLIKIEALKQEREELARQMTESMQQISDLAAEINQAMLSIDALDKENSGLINGLDERAVQFINEMERRAKERLLKYHYFMAKAYEYRMLEPYPGNLNLDGLYTRCRELVETSIDHHLSPEDFNSLKVLYEDQISAVAFDIYTDYNNNRPERSVPVKFSLSQAELEKLNSGAPLVINLHDLGAFRSSEENLRIVDLQVDHMDVHLNGGLGQFAYLDLYAGHSGESHLSQNGKDYFFFHYNENTNNPIVWGARYDTATADIDPISPSAASESLLYSLLSREGIPQTSENLLLYSRPGARSDISISKHVHSDNAVDIIVDSLRFEVEYDFTPKDEDLVSLDVLVSDREILPYFKVGEEDLNHRRDGRGSFRRTYDISEVTGTALTAQERYGMWSFEKWTVPGGASPGSELLTAEDNPEAQVDLGSDRTLVAFYIYDIDFDRLPDQWELEHFSSINATDGASDDDGDGLSARQEYKLGTNPQLGDSDGDGMPDGWEFENNLDPLTDDALNDDDLDNYVNLQEYFGKSDPWDQTDIPVSHFIETFETGGFKAYPWTLSGDKLWSISGQQPYNGTWSAQAPNITGNDLVDEEYAAIETRLYCEDGEISFWYAVSSEDCGAHFCDGLKFYINGVLINSWAGIRDWEKAVYPVSEGLHTFRWEYIKDKSFSGGEDTAWIDDIRFPADQDLDADGMPDSWEKRYGLNTLANDAFNDHDQDGFANIREYLCATDPEDSSVFPISEPLLETFETGTLDFLNWIIDEDGAWLASQAKPYNGNWAAQSPDNLSDVYGNASIETSMYCEKGSVRFRFAVSSEFNYDFLKFYLDGNLQGQWSGDLPYSEAVYEVTEGMHTFKWVYDKDKSGSDFLDKAWIDNITFPFGIDTDSDGMPDGWELQYDMNALHDDAQQDTDKDGFSNLREYLSNTHPQDSSSFPVNQNDVDKDNDIDGVDLADFIKKLNQGIVSDSVIKEFALNFGK